LPTDFGVTYTFFVTKQNVCEYSKSLTGDDFRRISISPVFPKVIEHCILERFYKYFVTSDNQFGFKRNSSCAPAI